MIILDNPERYGVVTLDEKRNIIGIEEKPDDPKTNYAIPGLYYYDNTVVEKAKTLKPSARGELEITDLNNCYLKEGKLGIQLLDNDISWFDAGTHESLLQASNFIASIEQRQGFKIACIEEIAFRKGYITPEQLNELAKHLNQDKNQYGQYLMMILRKEKQVSDP